MYLEPGWRDVQRTAVVVRVVGAALVCVHDAVRVKECEALETIKEGGAGSIKGVL